MTTEYRNGPGRLEGQGALAALLDDIEADDEGGDVSLGGHHRLYRSLGEIFIGEHEREVDDEDPYDKLDRAHLLTHAMLDAAATRNASPVNAAILTTDENGFVSLATYTDGDGAQATFDEMIADEEDDDAD